MPPKKSITLTEAELRLMKVLWERGESAVAELVAAVSDELPLAYTSVLTTVRILENKGYVRHRQEGRGGQWKAALIQQDIEKDGRKAELFDQPDDMIHRESLRADFLPRAKQ